MKNKTVAILMPVFNSEKTLKRAIISLLNQTYEDFLVIIIDDGSTDKSLSILNSLNLDDRLKVFTLNANYGVGKALAYGADMARKIIKDDFYISRLDSDDEYAHDFLEKRVKILNQYPDIYMLYGGIKAVNGHSLVPDANNENKMIHISETSQGATIFIRSQSYFESGGYASLRFGEDYDLFKRIEKMNHKIFKVDFEDYHYYRDNKESLTTLKELYAKNKVKVK